MPQRAKRRRYYPRPVDVKEPVRSGFTLANLINLGAIPIITAGITFLGFYYGTNYRLERASEEIKAIQSKLESTGKVITDKTNDDAVQREKIRDAFLQAQSKTNDGIAKLDTRLAVAEQQQKTSNEVLAKISDTLQKISAFPQPPPPDRR